MATRHDVQLTYKDGKRELLIDGEKVKGVRSVTVALDVHDAPAVVVELTPATLTFLGEEIADLNAVQNQTVDNALGDEPQPHPVPRHATLYVNR